MTQERILIVEDEARVAQALCRVLTLPEGGGHLVESCESGEAALERVKHNHFDLVITDLRIPGINGLDLLEEVHRLSPGTRTVLITAYGTPQVEERAKELADAYIVKPFNMQGFVRTVRQILAAQSREPRRLVAFSENGLRAVQRLVENLRTDAGAAGAVLFDPGGQLLIESGKHGDFDLTAFLVSQGNAMTAANQVIHTLQDEASFNLQYHEGKNYEIYTTRITDQVFLSMLFGRQTSGSGRVGMIWISLRRGASEIRETLAQAMITRTKESTPPPPHRAPIVPAPEPTVAPIPEPPVAAVPESPVATTPEPPAVTSAPVEPSAPTPPTTTGDVSVLTYEQARALGLINLDNFDTNE